MTDRIPLDHLTSDQYEALLERLRHAEAALQAHHVAAASLPPDIARTHTWDGTRNLPDWLHGRHRFDNQQLVIHTPDGETGPEPGWTLVRWADGIVTVASPAVAERVYGPDGLAGGLARAEAALTRVRAECAALDRDLQDAEDDGMRAALTRIRHALDARPADDTAATQATEPGGWLHAGTRDLSIPDDSPVTDIDPAWTPPPPGDTREQLPDHLLDLIRGGMPNYLSTACQTADTLACAACYPGSGVPHPQYDEIREHAERLHNRCRINQKFTGQLCACGCH